MSVGLGMRAGSEVGIKDMLRSIQSQLRSPEVKVSQVGWLGAQVDDVSGDGDLSKVTSSRAPGATWDIVR